MRSTFFILFVAILFISAPALAQTDSYQMYLGGYPQQETSWSDDAQGVAHDDNNWFITQTLTIWKIPVQRDLRTVTSSSTGVIRVPLSAYAALAGFDHTGDPVVYRHNSVDYLLVPIEGPGKPGSIAFFHCTNLAYIAHIALPTQGGDAGWCATDQSGLIYSSLQHATLLNVFVFNWDVLQASGTAQISFIGTQAMLDETNAALDLVTMQGGEFGPGPDQLLYLVSGFYDDDDGLEDREGLHILQRSTDFFGNIVWRRVGHSTRGFGHFDFYYDPGFDTYEEPEGLTIWDLDSGVAPNIRGQLHAFVLDNDIDAGDIDFKHYTSTIRVNPTIGCTSGFHPGTPNCPYHLISAAANLAWSRSEIRIRAGNYSGPLTISRRTTLTAESGLVRIGN